MGRYDGLPLRVKISLLFIWPLHTIVRRLVSAFTNFQSLLFNAEVRLMNPEPKLGMSAVGVVPVLTTSHCQFIAERLAQMLRSVGIRSDVITAKPAEGFSAYPHIVICPQMFQELPKTYYAFQMEQSVNPRWFTKSYFKILRTAQAVFDYSMTNLAYLEDRAFNWKKVFYLPVTADPSLTVLAVTPSPEEAYDVVFYGDDKNQRRRRFLDALEKSFRVKVINNQFGEALYSELSKAKVIVNIHYYENALLETTRLAEALSLGALIVSEDSKDRSDYPQLDELVDFVPVDDAGAMVERVAYWLRDGEARRIRKQANHRLLTLMPDMMEFYFFRFLLAHNFIEFKTFYERCARHINVGSFMCLGLPEVQSRMRDFLKLERREITYFSGIRHQKGWIGCALSYKFLLLKAREQGLEQIAICEDDVEFPSDWEFQLQKVNKYLVDKAGGWHVFSGLMAVVSPETRVKKIVNFSGLTFAHVDRMMSTVFNVYSKRVFDVFARWDETDIDPNRNTIDKYMGRQPDLDIVTTRPFLVGHKHEAVSTLWGIGNTQYDPMIAKSGVELSRKIDQFIAQK
jgi:hypothetical protein